MSDLMWLPRLASAQGAELDRTLGLVHVLMLLLFVGWLAFFCYVIFRFRRARNPVADYAGVKSHASTWLEVGVAVAEGILLVAFSFPIWAQRVAHFPPESDAVVVRVIAEQFAWNVHYPGPDGKFGRTDAKLVQPETNPIGLDRSDPDAKDDIVAVNQLHLPVNRPAIVKLSSKDVIHCFNLPYQRVKQDIIPGVMIPVWFTPTVTTAEMRTLEGKPDFNFEIACAQLCGLGHYRMRGFLTVETPDEYKAWLDAQEAEVKKAGEGGFWN